MSNWSGMFRDPGKEIAKNQLAFETLTENSILHFLEENDGKDVTILYGGSPVSVRVISASGVFKKARLRFFGSEEVKSFDFNQGDHGMSLLQE